MALETNNDLAPVYLVFPPTLQPLLFACWHFFPIQEIYAGVLSALKLCPFFLLPLDLSYHLLRALESFFVLGLPYMSTLYFILLLKVQMA